MDIDSDQVLLEFPVLWQGWECDSKAWVRERPDQTRYLHITHCGFAREGTREFLERKQLEYATAMKLTQQAMDLLKESL